MSATTNLATAVAASTTSINPLAVASSTDAWEKALFTLLGTFIGAMLAFFTQIVLRRREERKAEQLAAHRILFCLFQQMNTIVLFQRENIAPRKNSPAQFIEIPATLEFDLSTNLFEFESFGFLLKSSEGRRIMHDLYLAQECYVATLRAINDRSRMHRELLQPKLSESGFGTGNLASLQELAKVLGPLIHGTMVNSTAQIILQLQYAFEKLIAAKLDFRAFAVSYFKTTDFTEFEFPETYGLVIGKK
ncbi:hypothetical protein [Janthinobacterium sp. P210006]|uniref:hypothetical protein n=1 Tax=Janthinobacterium sp. P210006 TaxID=3112939 RepID=UPI002E275CAB|nr:hypothetical protein [Janthinobacterium sp. P210006]